MFYRDSPTVEASLRIATSTDQAWAAVTDIALPTRFSAELTSVEWLDGADHVSVGARFRGHNAHPALGEWSTDAVVTEVIDGRRWTWDVHAFEGTGATWAFEIEPASSGVIVRQWGRMGPGRSGLSLAIDAMPDKEARIVANRIEEWRTAMAANLAGLEDLLTRR